MWAMTVSQPGEEGLGRRVLERDRVSTRKRETDKGGKEYPGLLADQNRKRRKEGASTGKYEENGPILALPLSCGPELAAPQPSVSAAAPGAGLQMREKCKEAILQLLSLPLHALCPAWC